MIQPGGPGAVFNFAFGGVGILVMLIFAIVMITIIFSIIRYVGNASSPVERRAATIIGKRIKISNHMNDNMNQSITHYYISLEFPDGTRAEFVDKKRLYGVLVEGDEGIASIQGEWLVDFSRNMIV